MSKKQARQKKLAEGAAEPVVLATKALCITPQIPVAIHGEFPNQYLTVEDPAASGSRKKITLTPQNIYSVLMVILQEKAGQIELERQLAKERANKPGRAFRHPDWRLIAKHPMAEIRQGLTDARLCAKGSVTVLPTRASRLASDKSDKTLDEMGL